MIEGPNDIGKTALLAKLQETYRDRGNARSKRDIDAFVDLSPSFDPPQVHTTLETFAGYLKANASKRRPVFFFRFRWVLDLYRQDIKQPAVDRRNPVVEDVGTAARAIGGAVAAESPAPLVQLGTLQFRPTHWLWRRVERRLAPKADAWFRELKEQLPEGDSFRARQERRRLLQPALLEAFVADVVGATKRRFRRLNHVTLFVDAYDRVEAAVEQREFITDLARGFQSEAAPVLVVASCRHEELWTKLAKDTGGAEHGDAFLHSPAVHIRWLAPLSDEVSHHVLAKWGVPAQLSDRLVRLAKGWPMALALLGVLFGRKSPALPHPDPGVLARLEARTQKDADASEAWMREFAQEVTSAMLDVADEALVRHVRAAAVPRAFNRALLHRLLGQQFSGEAFERLVRTPLIDAPRHSPALDDRGYRARGYVRQLLALGSDVEREAVEAWHRRAAEHFDAGAASRGSEGGRYASAVEALHHRLFFDPQAEQELLKDFVFWFQRGRLGRCAELLAAARDAGRMDPRWRIQLAMLGAQVYLASGRYELAKKALGSALRLVTHEFRDPDERPILHNRISAWLSTLARMQGLHAEARESARTIPEEDADDRALYDRYWRLTTSSKLDGHLARARREAAKAAGALERVAAEPNEDDATSSETGWVRRRQLHLLRHQADVARLGSDYVDAHSRLQTVIAGYGTDDMSAAVLHARLQRSHLLRLEGLFESAVEEAQELCERFGEIAPHDPRSLWMTTRSLAQALSGLGEYAEARSLFGELVDADSGIYRAGPLFGNLGLGEISRVGGDYPRAERHYAEAVETESFEKVHVYLAWAECARESGDRGEAHALLREVSSDPRTVQLPVCSFFHALVSLRVEDGPENRAMAEAELGRFRRRAEDRRLEDELYDATVKALDADEPLSPLPPLNFP